MFDGLAKLAVRWPKLVLMVTVLLVGGALLYGLDVLSGLKQGGQIDPGSESAKGAAVLDEKFGAGHPNVVFLVSSDQSVDDPAVAAEGNRLAQQLSTDHDITGVV